MKILNKKFFIGFFIFLIGLISLFFNRRFFYGRDITFWFLLIITLGLIFWALKSLVDKIIDRYLK